MAYSYEPHYFEEFEAGETFQSVGRTVTEADFTFHSMFTGDWTELHSNAEYAADQEFGERIAHGPMTFVLATGFVYRCGFLERRIVPRPLSAGRVRSRGATRLPLARRRIRRR